MTAVKIKYTAASSDFALVTLGKREVSVQFIFIMNYAYDESSASTHVMKQISQTTSTELYWPQARLQRCCHALSHWIQHQQEPQRQSIHCSSAGSGFKPTGSLTSEAKRSITARHLKEGKLIVKYWMLCHVSAIQHWAFGRILKRMSGVLKTTHLQLENDSTQELPKQSCCGCC